MSPKRAQRTRRLTNNGRESCGRGLARRYPASNVVPCGQGLQVIVGLQCQPRRSITDTEGEESRTLRPLQAAAITYRIAFGPRAGQKVLSVRGAMPREGAARQPLCADIGGFNLHAAVRVQAHDRKRLEQLCRYITRPALSDERVQLNAAGQVELKLNTPWRDGTTHLVMSPLEFMQRLAEPVPWPSLRRAIQPGSGRSRTTLDGREPSI